VEHSLLLKSALLPGNPVHVRVEILILVGNLGDLAVDFSQFGSCLSLLLQQFRCVGIERTFFFVQTLREPLDLFRRATDLILPLFFLNFELIGFLSQSFELCIRCLQFLGDIAMLALSLIAFLGNGLFTGIRSESSSLKSAAIVDVDQRLPTQIARSLRTLVSRAWEHSHL
jgi:hypothetical protein